MALKIGQVIDNNSLNSPEKSKNGRCKILVFGVHAPTEDVANLPWALCGRVDQEIPEINDIVIVDYLDERAYKKLVYYEKLSMLNLNDFTKFDDNVKPNVSGFAGVYPNVKYKYYDNGACLATTSDSGEFLFFKNSTTYFYISNSGEIISKAGSGTIEPAVLGDTLKTILENLIDIIIGLTVNLPTASPPLVPLATNPATVTLLNAIKLQISTILSSKVKLN